MDALDELMDRSTQPVAEPDTVDDAMDAYIGGQVGAVRAGATVSLDANPDEIARQKRIAQSLGVPLAAVEADPEFATREQRMRSIEQATANSPALRQKFSEADFAKLAGDNVENLSAIEQLWRSAKRGWTAGLRGLDAEAVDDSARILSAIDTIERGGVLSPNDPLASMFTGSGRSPEALKQMRAKHQGRLAANAVEFTKRTTGLNKLQPTGATADFYQAKGWGESLSTLLADPFEISANIATESLGIMAPGMPAIITGGVAGGARGLAGMVGATSTNAEYSTAIAEALQAAGVDLNDLEAVKAAVATPEFAETRRKATVKAAVVGAFDAATAGVAGVRLRPSMAGNLAAQTAVQAAGGAAGEALGSVASGQEVNASSVLAEAIGEIPGAVFDVATMAGRRTLEGQRKADQAEQSAAFVENINNLAAADKLLQRDADTFEQFVAAAAEDGPVDTVFVDGRMLMQSGMAPRLADLSPSVREQLDRAILTGGDIAIPVSEYAARIAPTDLAPQLIDHIKTEADGFTRAEAQDFMANQGAELQAEVDRILTEREDADVFRQSQDVVKQDILGQLNTAGRFTPQVNEAYATLASSYSAVRAAQLGMTPEEFHQQRGMKVQGEAVVGQGFSQGGIKLGDYSAATKDGGVIVRVTPGNFADTYWLEAVKDGDVIGSASIGKNEDSDTFSAASIAVDEAHRRKGVASAMYDAAHAAGIRLVPSNEQSREGRAIWKSQKTLEWQPKQTARPLSADPIQTDTAAFKRWFGDSKVVDADGKPLVVYHGTTADIEQFRQNKATEKDAGWYGTGIYMTADPNTASAYSGYEEMQGRELSGAPRVMPLYVSMQNPYVWPKDRAAATTPEEASAIRAELEAAGHDGVLVPNEYADPEYADHYEVIAFRPEQIKSAIGNRGTFDPADPNILNQPDGGAGTVNRGGFSPDMYEVFGKDGKTLGFVQAKNRDEAIAKASVTKKLAGFERVADYPAGLVTLLNNADLSTFLHESAHYFFENDIGIASELLRQETLTPGEQAIVDDVSRLLKWHGIQGDIAEQLRQWHTMDFEEQRAYHERTAESFEAYLFSGKAPSLELQPMFQRFASWMVKVYESLRDFLKRNPEAGKLNDEVRQVFDRMIATREEIALAQQARSMIPLFNDPAKSGVSVETIADIQAQHAEATAAAVDELQAKGMRDLQWLANAKGRQIARLKREAKGLRSEVEIEARREVMSQPVYRAWEFLTGKPSDKTEAQTENELEVADWKQRRVEAMESARDQAKKDAWDNSEESKQDYETGRAKGMAKGQFLARNKKDIDLVVARAALDWDRANPKPEYAKDSNVFDTGEQVFGKFNRAALEDMGIPAEIVGHIRKLRMTADDGMHPDLVATMFDFSSGDELVRTLAAAQSPKEAITELADRLMLERHGELATPEAIELAADAAIHNDARARMVATEYNALAKATGDRKLLTAAAKEYAAQIVARLKVRDIRPSQYANAETRAAKAAMKASAKGDMQTAAAEKRNQVINLYATRAAYDAKDEVKATMRAWSKLVARSDKTKSVDIDLLNAVRAILGEYGIAPKRAERAADYLKSVQAYDPEMYAVIQASVESAEANAKPVNELTLTEFRALRDEIDSIMHLAKRSRQMEIDGDMLDIADVQDELMARMTDYGIPDKIPGEGQAVTPGEERMNKLKSLLAFARRVESWVGQMDGKQQMGPFRRYVWSRISDAAVAYRTDKAAYLKQFRALVASIAPTLKPMLIHAPELGYTFGKDSGGSAINEILHAVLHTGNESNKRKMLLGRGWAVEVAPGQLDTTRWDAFIARMVAEGKITQAHYDFAQGVWDMLDSMKPAAQKTHRDVFGKYFDEVTANPFTDPFGVKRAGGYIPAMTDSRVVKDAELRKLADEDNAAMSYAFPSTPKGFTQARTEYNKPLMLDLRTLGQHIDKVLLFSHMEMPVREVQRVLSNRVGETLNRIDQTAISGMLLPWLNRSAKQQVETPIAGSAGTMRFFSVMRSHAGMAAMFGNLANTVQQLTGFSLAAVKVKPSLLLSATADYIKSPREFARSVAESSAYMNTRMANEVSAMTDAIDDILLNPSKLKKGQAWTQRHAYFLQSAMDNSMSPIIWTAAYNQAAQNGANHGDAVRLADGTVRQTQGAMQAEDIARIEGGNAFVRMFTQFAGYFNMNANLLGTEYVRLMHDGGLRKNAGRGVFLFLMGYMVPAVVGELIIQAFRGGPGDDDDDGEYLDDWIAAVFGWAPLRYATAMVPVGGQAVNATVNAMNSKPYDDRLATSPAISMLESAVRAPVSVYKSVAGEGSSQKAVRDVATLMSMTLGLPANFVARPVGYGVGVMDDDIEPTGGFDFARGVMTGTASPDSKTQ